MGYSNSVRLLFEEVRSLGFNSIVAGYMGVGTIVENPSRLILVQNFTDANLMFSFDGVTDHFPLVTAGHLILDIAANKTKESGFFLAEGDRLYVKRIGTPTVGTVYFSTCYGKN